jgi:hypothetical protein
MERRAAIKFCFKLGKSASETYELLQKLFGSRWRLTMEKSRVKTMFIAFFDAQGVIHREFVPEGQIVNGQFYLRVMERLL